MQVIIVCIGKIEVAAEADSHSLQLQLRDSLRNIEFAMTILKQKKRARIHLSRTLRKILRDAVPAMRVNVETIGAATKRFASFGWQYPIQPYRIEPGFGLGSG